jgi:rod shape-determining protein MreC
VRKLLLKSTLVATVAALVILWLFAQQAGRAGAGAFVGAFLQGEKKLEEAARLGLSVVSPWTRGPGARIRDLEARLRSAEIRLAAGANLRRENAELRKLLNLPPIPGWNVIFADVIARDPLSWDRGFRIGRGRLHGIVPGSIVLAGPFVIGRVVECGERNAMVATVASRACRFGVVLERGRETGVLQGIGTRIQHAAPACVVEFLPKETVADPGDVVWTSGLGRSIPGGLVVGRVANRAGGKPAVEIIDGAYARVRIVPSADFDHLRVVAVVCPHLESDHDAGHPPEAQKTGR